MKKLSSLVIGLVLCANAQAYGSGHGHHNHSSSDQKTEKKAKKAISKTEQAEVLSALEANEALHASFFEYKAQDVEKNAKNLSAALSKISNKEIKKLLTFSKTKLSEIKKDADRDANNKAYNTVSLALIHVMNTYDLGPKYKSYTCPMVKKRWVQNTDKMVKVHNPYAPEMPHCGRQDKGQ